jgi:glycosyltransferase involved in cell wall biosynthesis
MKLLFLSPLKHHSYFTALALSNSGDVVFLCPALELSFLLKEWSYSEFRPKHRSVLDTACVLIAILLYCLFKLQLLTEFRYRKLFQPLARFYQLIHRDASVVVFYQDHLSLSKIPNGNQRILCELIIDTNTRLANWQATTESSMRSDLIVIPNLHMSHIPLFISKPYIVAPYGGDQVSYLKSNLSQGKSGSTEISANSISPNTIIHDLTIVARSNSYRKGLDILLSALLILKHQLVVHDIPIKLRILIAGTITDPNMLTLYDSCKSLLDPRSISLSYSQYSTQQYLSALSSADLFIMPSRLESTSLAALEALYHGVPSILSKQCGIGDFKPHSHGLLLSSLEPSHLARLILFLLKSPHLLQQYRRSIVRDQNLFTWKSYVDSYSNLLANFPCTACKSVFDVLA